MNNYGLVLMFTEELKRVNSSISKAFDEKLKLVSKISNIPTEEISTQLGVASQDSGPSKDAKDLVVACMHQGIISAPYCLCSVYIIIIIIVILILSRP